jgi:geranylgeranyl pyrophosphate synthase
VYRYGKHLGVAFQLVDDALDFTGTNESLGAHTVVQTTHGLLLVTLIHYLVQFCVESTSSLITEHTSTYPLVYLLLQ